MKMILSLSLLMEWKLKHSTNPKERKKERMESKKPKDPKREKREKEKKRERERVHGG
jgi:hypothetical protein